MMMSETVHRGHVTCCAAPNMRRTYHRHAQSNSLAGASHCQKMGIMSGQGCLDGVSVTHTQLVRTQSRS